MNRRELGNWGEKLALKELQSKGFNIIRANYQTKLGEIDLIGLDDEYLVFIEVKTRRSTRFGVPQTAVGIRKQQKIRRLAEYFIQQEKYHNYPIRFDVISIMLKDDDCKIEHLKNAF